MVNYTHILVAIDFSTSSEQVILKARDISQANKAKLSLLHVGEYLPPIDSAYEPMLNSSWVIDESLMQEQALKSLQQFSKKHGLEKAELNVQIGTPKYEISQFVKEQQCDLVILGSHGRHGISLLLGSTANAVLHDMPCDILAVKLDN